MAKRPHDDDDDDDDIPKIGLAKKRAEEEVPRIPRGRTKLNIPIRQLFLIGMTLITLIVILTMRKSCAAGVGKAFNNLAPPPADAGIPDRPLRERPVPSTPGR